MARFNSILNVAVFAIVVTLGVAVTFDRANAQARRQPPSQVLGNGISISTGNAAGGTSVRASMSTTANRLQTSGNGNRIRGYRDYSNRFGDRGFLVEVYRY
ncbi:MAG: hypothetical protein AAF974_11515 [Cyanobacteria bacterium P01_E01_bin.34]